MVRLSSALAMAAQGAVKQMLDKMHAHTPAAIAKMNEFVASHGEGCWIHTTDNKKYLDMTSGIGVVSTGHCHPKVVEAVRSQAGKIVHAQQNVVGAHEPYIQLVERLQSIMPPHLSKYFLCNSGAEAVENAIKVARTRTGRQTIIAFEGGYHGRTMGSMALTSSKNVYMAGFGPLMPGVRVAPYPYCLHCKAQCSLPENKRYGAGDSIPKWDEADQRGCCNAPIEALEWMLKMQVTPGEVAAIILEPILGEGGFLVPPTGFLQSLRKIADEHGIMLIYDEVQAGVGRTGKWWGHQHLGPNAEPDMIIFAKGIASGYPLAGLAGRNDAFDKCVPGSLGGTYGGNAVVCAAAVATVDVLRNEKVLENAQARGQQLVKGLMRLRSQGYPIIDVRGRGLMVALEFGGQAAPKGCASALTKACAEQSNVLLLTAGARETIRFLPPLTISAEEIDLALAALEKGLQAVFKK